MDIEEKAFNLLENLKSIKFSASLTDAHKEFFNFRWELRTVKPEVPYAEIENEENWNSIANTAICKKWWQHMADVMPANPDNSPIAENLKEVFHID